MLTKNPFILIFTSLISVATVSHAAPQTIPSEQTIDAGDYYLGLNGEPIHFYRKKDLFLKLDSIKAARQQKRQSADPSAPTQRTSALRTYTPGYSAVDNHRWGALEILKADQTATNGVNRRLLSAPSTRSNAGLAPVFTSENGRGEYLILPDIIVSFSDKQAAAQHQQAMLDQFGMHVKNQMMFSDTNFVLTFDSPVSDYSKVFSTTRDLMALSYIEWAEPNMQVKLKQTAAPDPNDFLFREQWGLYNWGFKGEFCNANTDIAADIDADDAWALMDTLTLGPRPVIAIIDDGVKLTHSDLRIWTNPSPGSGIPFPHTSGNRCEQDTKGCNFGDFSLVGGARVYNGDPSPQAGDTHGTQAAGIAAARRNNMVGISGSAYNAEIVPIRLEGFGDAGAIDCVALEDALSYAAKYADIISNSWKLDAGDLNQSGCKTSLDAKLTQISNGHTAYKRSTKGTPILFASGNAGTGWQKISISIPTANSTVKLTLHEDDLLFTDFGENAVWIDNVQLPGSSIETFGSSMPSSNWKISNEGTNSLTGSNQQNYNGCSASPSSSTPVSAAGNHTIDGTGYAIKLSASLDTCKYLEISNVNAGTLNFWVWISTETWSNGSFRAGELFRTYVNGIKSGSDLISRSGQSRGINNEDAVYHDELAYPASHPSVIAVGASNNGKAAGREDRAYFSQYGPTLDVLAPGTAIRSTTSSGGYGYLSGTSASAPMVAGIVANMLAATPNLTTAQIRTHLRNSADQIGPQTGEFAYVSGFNKYYGHGRANSYNAVRLAKGMPLANAPETCEDPNPGAGDDFLLLVIPAIISGALKNK